MCETLNELYMSLYLLLSPLEYVNTILPLPSTEKSTGLYVPIL